IHVRRTAGGGGVFVKTTTPRASPAGGLCPGGGPGKNPLPAPPPNTRLNRAADAACRQSGHNLRMLGDDGVSVHRHVIVEGRLRTCLLYAVDGAFSVAAKQLFIRGVARSDLDQIAPKVLVGHQPVESRLVTFATLGVIARVVFQILVGIDESG